MSEYVILIGPLESRSIPIPCSLPYDQIQVHSDQSVSIAAGVADVSIVGENLTWISTTRNYVLTHGDPSDDVEAEVQAIQNHDYSFTEYGKAQPKSLFTGPGEAMLFLIEFSLQYDFERIEERNTYSVSVRIEDIDSDELTWIFVPPCPN
ncbi:hypothetical protein BGZ80_004335 [Entomortierella chlamydospora]|uniref:Uncharacterized protein n=1 Tax=Entomortierella chlamydospora TaxID=101097 RepID=A0A9P6N1F6_9FUNG|nr:hypothetical protein BGZ80_004335 [Entomortierella chlamydospora]